MALSCFCGIHIFFIKIFDLPCFFKSELFKTFLHDVNLMHFQGWIFTKTLASDIKVFQAL